MNSQAKPIVRPELDYEAYAPHFDSLCQINPAYQDLLDLFLEQVSLMDLGNNPRVVDLGAGTGNFVCPLISEIPDAEVTHIDCSPDMNEVARQKYEAAGFNVNIVESLMQTAEIEQSSRDLVVCVNALNNAPPVRPMLFNIFSWLKPGGHFFLIDFGREINVVDWTYYLVRHLLRTEGFLTTLKIVRQQAKVISINQKGKGDQRRGTLWTHTSEEIVEMLRSTGFEIRKAQTCYRGYADMVLARKPMS